MARIVTKKITERLPISPFLLECRFWFFTAMTFINFYVTFYLLSIDFTVSKDPRISSIQTRRWKLITAWFNFIMSAYLPMSAYCDWNFKSGRGNKKHLGLLEVIRYYAFTSIIFPTTCFSDITFWLIWKYNREFIAPRSVDDFVPYWSQHLMHTVTLIIVIVDLIIVKRENKKNHTLGTLLLSAFVWSYFAVVLYDWYQGTYVYDVMEYLTGLQLLICMILFYICHLFFYRLQWIVIEKMFTKKMKTL